MTFKAQYSSKVRYLQFLVVASALLVPGQLWATTCPDHKLDILLTNDDGYDQPGIQALYKVLKSAGHRVILAAPARNSSGSSASLTLAPVHVKQTAPDIYAIEGSPATSVLLALSALYPGQQPDLVVSGINSGANLGPATPISGTVGATVAALLISPLPVPGVAVSTDAVSNDETSAENLAHLINIAQFTARLIARLQEESCGKTALLPKGIALNVNYPPLAPDKIRGTQIQSQSKARLFSVIYEAASGTPGQYLPQLLPAPERNGSADSSAHQAAGSNGDTRAFDQGYITIVPIDADYTAGQATQNSLRTTIDGIRP